MHHKVGNECHVQLMMMSSFVSLMVINATFNDISAISWWPVLLVEEIGVPDENHRLVVSH